jgi:hypothetical protein
METTHFLDRTIEGLEAWDGDSLAALAPRVSELERCALEADETISALSPSEGLERLLRLSAAGAIALAQLIEIAEHAEDTSDVDRIGARLREAVAMVALHTASRLDPKSS